MEMPRVKIASESYDTPSRQFSKGTVIEITCEGQIGSDSSTVRINISMYSKKHMNALVLFKDTKISCCDFR